MDHVYSLEQQNSMVWQQLSDQENNAYRLQDELDISRGFKRIYPPLSEKEAESRDVPICENTPEVVADTELFENISLLSKNDTSLYSV
ncbi:hypothetical protein AGDE_14334 [Angomonas deanei]|nr:hypothetical protein AGDE_14334 [Angomonas deanei]|eukprot:EPY21025.1 hypothetical protein AGDE_14334 [Angomonas deanei]